MNVIKTWKIPKPLKSMQKWIWRGLGLALVAVAAYFVVTSNVIGRLLPQPTPQATQLEPGIITGPVTSSDVFLEGKLTPYQDVHMSFNVSGVVDTVKVKEGELVQEGQVLATLGNQVQSQAKITTAQLEVIQAQRVLSELYDNAALTSAQALYDMTQLQKEVDEAAKKRRALDYARGTTEQVDLARKDYNKAKEDAEKADQAYRSESQNQDEALRRLLDARKERDKAWAKLNYLLGNPSELEYSEADSRLGLATIKLTEAQRNYEKYKDGPAKEEVAEAQASLDQAKAQLSAAQADLAALELRAPFTGTVVRLDLKVGQYVNIGEGVILMADFSQWKVETTNLTELEVIDIPVGAPVEITFDALEDQKFTGAIGYIRALGENTEGDITYTAIVDIDEVDPRLRWNMTASLEILKP